VIDQKNVAEVVLDVIKGAGEFLCELSQSNFTVDFKSKTDMVTSADKAVEDYIVSRLQAEFPSFSVFSEEVGLLKADNTDFLWLIDPIDGTTNFVHGFLHYCVSIALTHHGTVILGAVNDPTRGEIFHALQGEGAYLNGSRISVSDTVSLSESLVVTGFTNADHPDNAANMRHFTRAVQACQAVRRTGSAALDLSNVACGRLDGYLQKGIDSYDIAAGCLIVKEAGGKVSNLDGHTFSLTSGEILATNGLIHAEMQRLTLDQQ